MSFIQFESARDKEKARQDLREEREHLLVKAKKKAEQRAETLVKKTLTGETNWMLNSVNEKLKKKSKELKKFKKSKDKKHSKKLKKKSHKKRKRSTSEDESESSSNDSDDTDSSLSHNNKNWKKTKKKRDKSSTRNNFRTDEGTDDEKNNSGTSKTSVVDPIKRDSWMTGALMIKTYSKERVENKSNEKQKIDTYDPVKSSRELNPYWKTTGTGLPSFQKPKDEDDNKGNEGRSEFSQRSISTKGWRKHCDQKVYNESTHSQREPLRTPTDESSSSENEPETKKIAQPEISTSEFLTDQQMNELAAKILKSEIMGNMKLADELRGKLEKARAQRNLFKERQKSAYIEGKCNSHKSKVDKSNDSKDEHILLTHTDKVGNTRPLPASRVLDPRDLYGGKKKQKRVDSHDEHGKRVRYFADDDRYDIKQMFEREKYTNASDANLEFANIAGKHKNTNDDLEDIFAEKICKDNSLRSDQKDRNKAIREHQKIEAALDNCDKCFDSTKMQKELLVCVGETVYLALPWYEGLQSGHCMIIPTQHTSSCTQIDENTWTEINEFRKALTRMFAAQHKDVIFFEIANKLHRRPHLVIHCIPIRESDGEMAPFYFKKAIEESEHEWCINKQLVSLRNKSIRNSIPKGLPYFWVNFGMETGFAHVIEEEERFPANFAQEIIGGMLNLDANKWRQLKKEQNNITKVKMFADWWKKYDCRK